MNTIHRILGALALLATLILSLLPGGRAMKYLGPCGQQLCVCPDSEPVVKHSCCEAHTSHMVVKRTLTLTEESLNSVPGKLLSWTDDLTPTLQFVTQLGCAEEPKQMQHPDWHSSYRVPAFEIPHPPPRA